MRPRSPHVPPFVFGDVDKISDFGIHPWIENLKDKSVFVSLGTDWPTDSSLLPVDWMPQGYQYYIVSGDSVMLEWVEQMALYLQAPVIYLSLPKTYEFKPANSYTHFFPYTFTHNMCESLRQINIVPVTKNIKYKVSALTNRITQSKAIVFSALKKYLKEQDCLLSLNGEKISNKNVHNWELCGNAVCDEMMHNFFTHWKDKTLKVDDFFSTAGSSDQNSYHHPAYSESALNFPQESYHYSYHYNGQREYITPGPFITEKTLKCLLSATAFISTGQFDVYGYLSQAGMKFDYGELDLSYDLDAGNLTRLASAVNLIQALQKWSAQDLYEMTKESCKHNQEVVMSGDFYRYCESQNQLTIDQILGMVK
jgi:hypothetical protein